MTTFFYEGTDDEFRPVAGEIEATSESEVRKLLDERQIRVRTLTEKPSEDMLAGLSVSESVEVQSQVRELIEAELPLAEGLRAAAEEYAEPGLFGWFQATFSKRGSARVRRALVRIADAVEKGGTIERIMESRYARNEVRAIMLSGISSEATAMAVGEYSAYARSAARLRGRVVFMFAYPIVVTTLAFVFVSAFLCFVVPEMKHVFDDFGVELPGITQAVIAVSDALRRFGPSLVITTPIFLAALLVAATMNSTFANHVLGKVPLLGKGFRNAELSRLAHVLAIVLRHQAPVPKALRASGFVVKDRSIRNALVSVAEVIESGGDMPRSQAGLSGFPLAFVEAAHRTDDRHTVADALHSIADMFEYRSQALVAMLVSLLQPLILISVVMMVGLCFAAIMLPIIGLMGDLF